MPRFSIVVTTTDRQSFLPAAVRSVLAMRYDDYELIVSDNFSQPSAREVLRGIDDPRIRHLRTDRRLAMTDHWEFAWQHVRGDFVLYLGDDNALHPDILRYAESAIAQHDLELLSWRVGTYFHPDWRVAYGDLPDRGNILSFEPGTTGQLYRGVPAGVLRAYCDQLRLPACFPGMINCLFSRARAEAVRKRTGAIFWPLAPDIAVAYFVLGTARPDGFAWLDAYGAIGGRSQDSNTAAFLSEGKGSKRADDLFSEYGGADCFPHHPVKFRSMSNIFAVTISQAQQLLPEAFAQFGFAPKTLALRTLEDIHTLRITPWADDPTFVAQLEAFLGSLAPDDQAEVQAFRARCRAAAPPVARNGAGAARRSLWRVETSYYLDMATLGARDMADAAAQLPNVMGLLDRASDRFITSCRTAGQLAEALPCDASWPPRAAA